MRELIKKLVGDKREYRRQKARIEALPEDDRFVFHKMQEYMWSYAGGDGSDMLWAQAQLLELMESGAAQGRHVLEITGDDVAGFMDEFLRDTKKWTDRYSHNLNRDIQKRVKKRADHAGD